MYVGRMPMVRKDDDVDTHAHELDENTLSPAEQLERGLASREPMEDTDEYREREASRMMGKLRYVGK